ncbi:MAG: 5-oxoprolinase subunit PxpB [Verrucomicrobiota bacterium]
MILKRLGEQAWLVELGAEAVPGRAAAMAVALAKDRPPGVLDVVPSFDSLGVHFSGENAAEIAEWIGRAVVTHEAVAGALHEIPVVYGGEFGPDLGAVAQAVGMSADEVIALHSGADYRVAAVGFSPGFPYLTGLPVALSVPRKSTPGLAVAAGSVAVAAGQAGIYPFASPGGWQVLGRTDARLFDVTRARPAIMQPGDRVRFVAVDHLEPNGTDDLPKSHPLGERWMEVIEPGGQTTVQDGGRPGYEDSGVSPGGAVDWHALRVANLLVGNAADAAVLECCVCGPVIRFHGATTVAWVGGAGRSWTVEDGETVDFSKLPDGVRACLAVAGGISVPKVLGSAATDVRAGFGGYQGRALRTGDRLALGEAGSAPRCGNWHVGRPDARSLELRFLAGVQQDGFSAEARRRFRESVYQVTALSDRMGARLSGISLDFDGQGSMRSQPVVCGSVQVPPDGQPIVLLAERQTMGGYPQIGHVIATDLPLLARAWPGTPLRFREVTLDEARAARAAEDRAFQRLRVGLDLL